MQEEFKRPLSFRLLNIPLDFQTVFYFLIVVGVTIQQYALGKFNNYLMFARPFLMLRDGENPYIEHPEYFFDIYKYSPTSAFFFGVFQSLPDWLGLLLWNALNVIVLFTACRALLPSRLNYLMLWLIVSDVLTSVQNSQSNCLLAGLMIWSYILLKRKKVFRAGLSLAFASFIKIYGIAAGLLFLFFPRLLRSIGIAMVIFIVFTVLPLIMVSPAELISLYENWFRVVGESATAIQLSVMGILSRWFGMQVNAGLVQLAGLIILLIPVFAQRQWNNERYRLLYLSSLMIFVVIFNQMSESPTFIIAVAGFYIWYLTTKKSILSYTLLTLTLVFTSLSVTFLFPQPVREFFFDIKIKVMPMILAWLVIMAELYGVSFFQVEEKEMVKPNPLQIVK